METSLFIVFYSIYLDELCSFFFLNCFPSYAGSSYFSVATFPPIKYFLYVSLTYLTMHLEGFSEAIASRSGWPVVSVFPVFTLFEMHCCKSTFILNLFNLIMLRFRCSSLLISALVMQLEACIHPFFDELRDPNTRLPNGRPLPPLLNFKPQGNVQLYTQKTAILPHCKCIMWPIY